MRFTHTLLIDCGLEEFVSAEIEFSYDGEDVEVLSVTNQETGKEMDIESCEIDFSTLATVARDEVEERNAEFRTGNFHD